MLSVVLKNGTRFHWEQRHGMGILSNGSSGVAELAEIKREEVDYIEASDGEITFIKKYYPTIPCVAYTNRTRWSGEYAQFLIDNLRNATKSEKEHLKHQKRKEKKFGTPKAKFQ